MTPERKRLRRRRFRRDLLLCRSRLAVYDGKDRMGTLHHSPASSDPNFERGEGVMVTQSAVSAGLKDDENHSSGPATRGGRGGQRLVAALRIGGSAGKLRRLLLGGKTTPPPSSLPQSISPNRYGAMPMGQWHGRDQGGGRISQLREDCSFRTWRTNPGVGRLVANILDVR